MAKFLGGLTLPVLTADPAGAAVGSAYFNSTTRTVRVLTGIGWADTGPGFASMAKFRTF